MATGPHVSLSAEPIAYFGEFAVTNSMFTSLVLSIVLIGFAAVVKVSLKSTGKPTGLQNFAEFVIESLYNLVHSVTNNHAKTKAFLPLIATFFLFILTNNWFGLVPGVGTIGIIKDESKQHANLPTAPGIILTAQASEVTPTTAKKATAPESAAHESTTKAATTDHTETTEKHSSLVPLFRPGTADLNTTIALGIISVIAIQFFGVRYLKLSYFKKFINFSSPIMFFVGILEITSEFAKIISFAFRLFGNIFAGEVLLSVISFLAPLVIPIPFYGLEVFVGFIQALVFAMLTLVFFNMATISHEEH
jgi:F-type H+-transporting ATPase subunit a